MSLGTATHTAAQGGSGRVINTASDSGKEQRCTHTHCHSKIKRRLVPSEDGCFKQYYFMNNNNNGQQNLTFFFVPRTSTGELSSTFNAEFRYTYRNFLSDRVSKIQRNLKVQNSTLRAHETGRNFPLKCRGV